MIKKLRNKIFMIIFTSLSIVDLGIIIVFAFSLEGAKPLFTSNTSNLSFILSTLIPFHIFAYNLIQVFLLNQRYHPAQQIDPQLP